MKVSKFGGTSMANAQCISRVKQIVLSDAGTNFVVVSAPGKREKGDTKVTDLLYAGAAEIRAGVAPYKALESVKERFLSVIRELNLNLDIEAEIKKIAYDIENGADIMYIASRGEYLSALVTAEFFGWKFIDAAQIIRFDSDGKFDAETTDRLCEKTLKETDKAVIPGFYGAKENGTVVTFSRGGSDVSGAIIARAVNAEVYENWTDVDGFMKCDPHIVENPKIMPMLTYKELRELSYMGANVLHPDAIFPVRKKDIPINIRNTFNPSAPGTWIVPSKKFFAGDYEREEDTVTGIAGKKDFYTINIEKSMMNNELGFARKVLGIIESHNLSIEHMPSGIDTLSVVLDGSHCDDAVLAKVVAEIKDVCLPDYIAAEDDLALIAVVGHGMKSKKGTASKICDALYASDINIRMIDQGSSELNIILGVKNCDYEKAIASLYNAFIK